MKSLLLVILILTTSPSFAQQHQNQDALDVGIKYLEERGQWVEKKVQRYCHGYRDLKTATCTVLLEAGKATFNASLAVAGSYCANQFIHYINENFGTNINSSSTLNLVMGSALSGVFTSTVQSVIAAINNCQLKPINGLKIVHQELKLESKEKVEKLITPGLKLSLDKIDETINSLLSEETNFQRALLLLKKREQLLLSFPQNPKNISHFEKGGDTVAKLKLEQDITHLMQKTPAEIRKSLSELIQSIRDSSLLKVGKKPRRYFYGSPGTGKTTFIQNLGITLGLKICSINLTEMIQNESLNSHFFGGKENLKDNPSLNNQQLLGKIGECFLNSGSTNPIIFIDNASSAMMLSNDPKIKKIQEELRIILDAKMLEFPLQGLGEVKIPLHRITFLLAGNDEIEEQTLKSVIPQIHLPALGKNDKESAIHSALQRELADLKEIFSDDEVDSLGREIQNFIPYILNKDLSLFPGADVVQEVLKETLDHLRIILLNNKIPLRNEVEHFIDQSFDLRN